jgi:hypothetical protein
VVDGVRPLETYDYLFCGRPRAHFIIAELAYEVKIRIVEEGSPTANLVPSKFLPRFATLEKARAELKQLAGNGAIDAKLVRR